MAAIDILLTTCNRSISLAMTLAGIASQTCQDFRLIVADQSDHDVRTSSAINSLTRVISTRTEPVIWHFRPQRLGIAEQRAFLLAQAHANTVLYLDDDVFMESWVVATLFQNLKAQECGFVGAFPAGLSYLHDIRHDQQHIEFWDERVQPEVIEPGSSAWGRHHLHKAANLYHVSQSHSHIKTTLLYKIAWIASCVMYDKKKLLDIGGFSFWPNLPRFHSGEEVLVQNLLLRRYGGCGILPSGTYHAEEPSTVLNPQGSIDGHALALLSDKVRQYTA